MRAADAIHVPGVSARWQAMAVSLVLAGLIGAGVATLMGGPRLLDAPDSASVAVANPFPVSAPRLAADASATRPLGGVPPRLASPADSSVPLSADEAWNETELQLEAAWHVNTPRTVDILEAFVSRYPDYAFARPKLYAALIAYAEFLQRRGLITQAAEQLERARVIGAQLSP